MKTEKSAGGIVVRSVHGTWEVLVLRDANDAWTFPKGNIETGEVPERAARREIQEEVGLTALSMRRKLAIIRYTYKRNGFISKTVHYFLFLCNEHEVLTPQKEEGIHDATWMPVDRAIEIIGYQKANRPLLLTVKQWTLRPHQT